MSSATAKDDSSSSDNTSAVLLAVYIVGAVVVLLVLLCVGLLVKRLRWRSAKKYVRRQSARSIPMGTALADYDPVKRKPRPSTANGYGRPHSSVSTGRPATAGSTGRPQTASSNGRPVSAVSNGSLSGDSRPTGTIKQQRMGVRIQLKQEKRARKATRKQEKIELKKRLYSSAGPVVNSPPPSSRRMTPRIEEPPLNPPFYLNQVCTPPPTPPLSGRISRNSTAERLSNLGGSANLVVDDERPGPSSASTSMQFEAHVHSGSGAVTPSNSKGKFNVTEL